MKKLRLKLYDEEGMLISTGKGSAAELGKKLSSWLEKVR